MKERAYQDAALIDSLVAALRAQPAAGNSVGENLASRLIPVAEARRQHALALAVELGDTEEQARAEASQSRQPPPGTAPTALDSRGALSRVREILNNAQREAATLVPTLPRRQAALVGSIAAGCAAYQAVLI